MGFYDFPYKIYGYENFAKTPNDNVVKRLLCQYSTDLPILENALN